MSQYALDRSPTVCHLEVDLSTAWAGSHARLDQRRQWLATAGDTLGNEQPRNHAGITVGKITKIMMCTHLTAIDGIFGAHALLDERMAGFGLYRHTAGCTHHVDRVPGQPRIVDDLRTGFVSQNLRGKQADQVITFDEFALTIKKETAVEIAVPGDAKIRAARTYGISGCRPIFGQQRIWNAIRKTAIRFVINLHEVKRQMLFKLINDQASTAVSGIHDDLQRRKSFSVNITKQMLDIGTFIGIGMYTAAAPGVLPFP